MVNTCICTLLEKHCTLISTEPLTTPKAPLMLTIKIALPCPTTARVAKHTSNHFIIFTQLQLKQPSGSPHMHRMNCKYVLKYLTLTQTRTLQCDRKLVKNLAVLHDDTLLVPSSSVKRRTVPSHNDKEASPAQCSRREMPYNEILEQRKIPVS